MDLTVMSNYYMVDVMGSTESFVYPVPDVQKITGVKYKWILENKNKLDTAQAICCIIYPDLLPDNNHIRKIEKSEYDDFSRVILESDKKTINSNNNDYATVIATFPEGGGQASFIVSIGKDTESAIVDIGEDGIAVTPEKLIRSNKKGIFTISIESEKWVSISDKIYIESI